MLDKDQVAIASRTLHGHWRAGTKLDGLDPTLRPRDRIEGYAIQAEIARSSAAKSGGRVRVAMFGMILSDHAVGQ